MVVLGVGLGIRLEVTEDESEASGGIARHDAPVDGLFGRFAHNRASKTDSPRCVP